MFSKDSSLKCFKHGPELLSLLLCKLLVKPIQSDILEQFEWKSWLNKAEGPKRAVLLKISIEPQKFGQLARYYSSKKKCQVAYCKVLP